jgi:hypothetical protein
MPQLNLPNIKYKVHDNDESSGGSTGTDKPHTFTTPGGTKRKVQRFHSFSQPMQVCQMHFEALKKMDGREIAESFFPLPPPSAGEFSGDIDPTIEEHVSLIFAQFVPLREMEEQYKWAQDLFCGLLTKKVFVAAQPKTTRLHKLNSSEARYSGRALSKSLQDSSDATKGVYRWLKRNPAMKQLSEMHIFFNPCILTIAQKLKLAKSLKVSGRQGYRSTAKANSKVIAELQKELRRMSFHRPEEEVNEDDRLENMTDADLISGRPEGGVKSAASLLANAAAAQPVEVDEYDEDELDEGLMSRLGDAEDRVLDIGHLIETGEDIDETDTGYVTVFAPPTKKKKKSIMSCFKKKKKRIGF